MQKLLRATLYLWIWTVHWGCSPKVTSLSWQTIELNSPVTTSLRGLCVVSEKVVWVSGSAGTVLNTVDGGSSWSVLHVPESENLDFRDVQAFDEKTAILMTAGTPARLYRTEDSGAHWEIVYETGETGAFFDGMAFWDTRHGIAMSDPVQGHFLLLITEDGGRTWTEVPSENIPPPLPDEAGFAASGTSIAVGPDGLAAFGTSRARLLRTENWGESWQALEVPIRTGKPSQGVFSLCFFGDRQVTLVGGDYSADSLRTETAAYSVDDGLTWLPADIMPGGFCSGVAVHPVTQNELLAVGTAGCSQSSDGGRTWTLITQTGYHTVQCAVNAPIAFSTGSGGRIGKWQFK